MNPAESEKALGLLYQPGDVIELRIPNVQGKKTVAGYFDNLDELIRLAMKYSGKAPGIYTTLNPCKPELLARANNRALDWAKTQTADHDILYRRWLPIDFDPNRPQGISSTDAEHQAALQRAFDCRKYLTDARGWLQPSFADSGNGAHLLYEIDLPNDNKSRDLVQKCLQALALLFGDDSVSVDTGNYNAARIWKLYGTLACKGDNIPDRPHRLAKILDHPDRLEVVTIDKLKALADLVPQEPKNQRQALKGIGQPFDLDQFIARYGIEVRSSSSWNGGRKYVLERCVWNPEHNDKAAYIVQFASGAIAAGCHHNSCQGKGWHEFRDVFEADRNDRQTGLNSHNSLFSQDNSVENWESKPAQPWPVLNENALYGLPGEIVRAIEPHTEADPVAILVQFLCMFGVLVGRNAYFVVEAVRHYMNTFSVFVGDTSKARKGTSEAHVRRLIDRVAADFVDNCMVSGLSSGEGLIWQVRDPITKTEPVKQKGRVVDYQEVTTDQGIKDKRLLVLEPEFARVLRVINRDGNTLSTTIRQAWDTGDLRTLTKNSPARATGSHIGIIGHITVEELQRHMTETEAANGFGNRFLWLCVRRSKILPEGGKSIPASDLVTRLHEVILFATKVHEMTRSSSARNLWYDVYEELSEGKSGLLGAICGRAEAQVLRLSCLYALLDKSAVIEQPHLEAALALWNYAEASARYLFEDTLGDPLADEILRMLRQSQQGMTRTDISNALGRHRKANEIGSALTRLLDHHLVRFDSQSTAGRPVQIWYSTKNKSKLDCEKSEKSQGAEALNSLNSQSNKEDIFDEPAFQSLTMPEAFCAACSKTQPTEENYPEILCKTCGHVVGQISERRTERF